MARMERDPNHAWNVDTVAPSETDDAALELMFDPDDDDEDDEDGSEYRTGPAANKLTRWMDAPVRRHPRHRRHEGTRDDD